MRATVREGISRRCMGSPCRRRVRRRCLVVSLPTSERIVRPGACPPIGVRFSGRAPTPDMTPSAHRRRGETHPAKRAEPVRHRDCSLVAWAFLHARRKIFAVPAQESAMHVERTSSTSNLVDVLDRVLDKGIVIDAWVRVSLVGIDLITVEARVVVASIDTYLKYSEAVGTVAPVAKPAQIDVASHEAVVAENAALRARLAAGGLEAPAAPVRRRRRAPRT